MRTHRLWTVSSFHFVPTIVSLRKQSVGEVQPHVMSTSTWTNHWVEAELGVSDVLSSVAQRLLNEAEQWSKLQSKSWAGHFYRKGSLQTSKPGAPPNPEWLPKDWFFHTGVHIFPFSSKFKQNMSTFWKMRLIQREEKKNRSQSANKALVACWPISLLIKNEVHLTYAAVSQWGQRLHKNEQGHRFVSAPCPPCDTNNLYLPSVCSPWWSCCSI